MSAYCKQIDGICVAGNDALKCAVTECGVNMPVCRDCKFYLLSLCKCSLTAAIQDETDYCGSWITKHGK